MIWHFDKLPKDEHKIIIQSFEINDFARIAALYNKYRVSPIDLCSSCGLLELFQKTKDAIEKKIISHESEI